MLSECFIAESYPEVVQKASNNPPKNPPQSRTKMEKLPNNKRNSNKNNIQIVYTS
jgi:hypothetical protein